MDSRWTPGGLQMDSRWTPDGLQMDSRWISTNIIYFYDYAMDSMDSIWSLDGIR